MATIDYIKAFFSATTLYPSDSDVWWLYKDAQEEFDPAKFADTVTRGNSPAPKGYFILDAFHQDRSTESGVAGIPVVTSEGARPNTVEFFAGRVFFAGVDHKDFSSQVFFSQIIEDETQFGLCYQQNDPTSENSSDLLPTDGGVIVIPEAGSVFRLWAIEGSLLVFASNGVWAITGSSGIGFTASDYTVTRLSSIRTISASAFVDVSGFPMWWTSEGIYLVSGQGAGSTVPTIKSLSDQTFKTFIQNIPDESKKYIKGAYNPLDRVVRWVYRDTSPTTIEEQNQFNRVLSLNLVSGAFYSWSINPGVYVSGIATVGGTTRITTPDVVVDNSGVPVTNSFSDQLTVDLITTNSSPYVFKYLLSYDATGTRWTWGEEADTGLHDWHFRGLDATYKSYFITGYQIRGDALRDFQTNYIRFYSGSEESNQFFVQGIWDYASTGETGRWGSRQLLTFRPRGYDYDSRQVKIRGHGKAVQIKVSSNEQYPFDVIGWATWQTGNGTI